MICENCNKSFSRRVAVNDKIRDLKKRRYCLDCSPFNMHNTRPLLIEPQLDPTIETVAPQIGPQCKYCDNSLISKEENKNGYCLGCFCAKNSSWIHYQLTNGLGGKCVKCKYEKYTRNLVIYDMDEKVSLDVLSLGEFRPEKMLKKIQGYDILCNACMYEHKYDGQNEPLDMII